MDLGCNAHRVVRIQRDVGIDGMDHYFVVFQVVGGSTIIQNDRAVQLAVGDAALVRLISAKGAREFVKLQPNWLRHARFFLRNWSFAREDTVILHHCYLQNGDNFPNCHQQQE